MLAAIVKRSFLCSNLTPLLIWVYADDVDAVDTLAVLMTTVLSWDFGARPFDSNKLQQHFGTFNSTNTVAGCSIANGREQWVVLAL